MECLFSMASSATALVRSMVRRTEFRLRRSGRKGASKRRPVLSKDLSARASGYSVLMALTTAFVNGDAMVRAWRVLKLWDLEGT